MDKIPDYPYVDTVNLQYLIERAINELVDGNRLFGSYWSYYPFREYPMLHVGGVDYLMFYDNFNKQ